MHATHPPTFTQLSFSITHHLDPIPSCCPAQLFFLDTRPQLVLPPFSLPVQSCLRCQCGKDVCIGQCGSSKRLFLACKGQLRFGMGVRYLSCPHWIWLDSVPDARVRAMVLA